MEYFNGNTVDRWNLKPQNVAKQMSLHKQFSVDLAAEVAGVAWLPLSQSPEDTYTETVPVASAIWRFQAFKVDNPTRKLYDVSLLLGKKGKDKSIRNLFSKAPLANSPTDEAIVATTFPYAGGVEKRAKLVTSANLLAELLKSKVSDLVTREKPTAPSVSTE